GVSIIFRRPAGSAPVLLCLGAPLIHGGVNMSRISNALTRKSIFIGILALAALGGAAIAQQNKDSVQVPGGLALSEFKGYEKWQVIAVSQGGNIIDVIVGNPE